MEFRLSVIAEICGESGMARPAHQRRIPPVAQAGGIILASSRIETPTAIFSRVRFGMFSNLSDDPEQISEFLWCELLKLAPSLFIRGLGSRCRFAQQKLIVSSNFDADLGKSDVARISWCKRGPIRPLASIMRQESGIDMPDQVRNRLRFALFQHLDLGEIDENAVPPKSSRPFQISCFPQQFLLWGKTGLSRRDHLVDVTGILPVQLIQSFIVLVGHDSVTPNRDLDSHDQYRWRNPRRTRQVSRQTGFRQELISHATAVTASRRTSSRFRGTDGWTMISFVLMAFSLISESVTRVMHRSHSREKAKVCYG